MQEKFKLLMNSSIKPILKNNGYKKQGNTYLKMENELIYLIQFQKSTGNNKESLRFYINIGIYSQYYQTSIGKPVLEQPALIDCQINKRIEEITNSTYMHYQIDEWDIQSLEHQILSELDKVFLFMDEINSTEKLSLYLLSLKGIDYDLFHYFLAEKQYNVAEKCFSEVEKKFGEEERWERILPHYQRIADLYQFNINI